MRTFKNGAVNSNQYINSVTATDIIGNYSIGKYGTEDNSYSFIPFTNASSLLSNVYITELTIPYVGTWSRSSAVTYTLNELGIIIKLNGLANTGSCYIRLTLVYK